MREKLRLSFGTKTNWVAMSSFFTSSSKIENRSTISSGDNDLFGKKIYLYLYTIKSTIFLKAYSQISIPIYSTTFKQKIRIFNKDDFSLDSLQV